MVPNLQVARETVTAPLLDCFFFFGEESSTRHLRTKFRVMQRGGFNRGMNDVVVQVATEFLLCTAEHINVPNAVPGTS